MDRFFYAFLFALLFASCDKEDITIKDPELGSELVDVTFNVFTDKTKIMYDGPTEDNKFYPMWNTGDCITVVHTANNNIADFVIDSKGSSATMSGEIKEWDGSASVYAIYPYRSDAYSHNKNGHFIVNMASQTINASTKKDHTSTTSSMKNSVLVAKLDNVSFSGGTLSNTNDMFFRQAMSFLRFTLKGTDEEHKITKITLKDSETSIITEATIDPSDDEIDPKTIARSSEVYGIIEEQNVKGEAIINFALFPTTLTSPTLEITTTDKDGNYYKFTKTLPAGLKFIRNEFRFYSDPLDLEKDFTVEKYEIIDLDNLPSTRPSGNKFVVKSKDVLSKDDTTPLRTLLESHNSEINLTFPNVTELSLESVFESWKWLKSIELPICKKIGTATFVDCPILTKVVMPALEISGGATFDVRDEQPEVVFIAATNPGIKLYYAYNGVNFSPANLTSYQYPGYRIEKVNLILGNKHLYDEPDDTFRINGNNFLYGFGSETKAIYFKSITWQ